MNIKVIDNVLSAKALKVFEELLTARPWFLGHDGERLGSFSLGKAVNSEHFAKEEFYFLAKLKEHGENVSDIKRCYYNCFRKGDRPVYHKDYGRQTYMFYLNSEWSRFWGAPTKFKEKKYHISTKIFPKPGRLVIFDSSLWHKGNAPNFLMPGRIAGRMSVAFHEDFPPIE